MSKKLNKEVEDTNEKELEITKNFVYELQVFVATYGFYSLKDTVNKNFKEPLSKLTNIYKDKDLTIIERYELIGAPKSWLEKQNLYNGKKI